MHCLADLKQFAEPKANALRYLEEAACVQALIHSGRFLFVAWLSFASAAWAEDMPGFEAALQATLANHPVIRSKLALVESKEYAGDSARAQRYPSLSAQVAAQDNGSAQNTYPKTLQARQALWAFGRIDSSIAYADMNVVVDRADLARIARQLLEQTAVAYARLQEIRQRLAVAEENVAMLDALHAQIQRREQGRLASTADVRLAMARLVQAQSQQGRIEGELSIAQNELLALTQVQVSTDMPVPERYTALPAMDEVKRLAMEQGADVRLKTRQVDLADADVSRERTAAMPTLYLQANRYYHQPMYGDEVYVGVVLEGALDGMGFAAVGRSNAASARLQASREELATTRNEIGRIVKGLYTTRELQQNQSDSLGKSVAELTEILASYQRQYEAGMKSWLDLLNMQRELTEQRFQQAQANGEWLVSSLKLAAMTGMLDSILAGER